MSAKLRGRVEKLEDRNGVLHNDEWFRDQLRQFSTRPIDVDAIPAGKAGAVYIKEIGREVF